MVLSLLHSLPPSLSPSLPSSHPPFSGSTGSCVAQAGLLLTVLLRMTLSCHLQGAGLQVWGIYLAFVALGLSKARKVLSTFSYSISLSSSLWLQDRKMGRMRKHIRRFYDQFHSQMPFCRGGEGALVREIQREVGKLPKDTQSAVWQNRDLVVGWHCCKVYSHLLSP